MDLDICDGQPAEICSEGWNDVASHVRKMVVVDQSPEPEIHDVPHRKPRRPRSQRISLVVDG